MNHIQNTSRLTEVEDKPVIIKGEQKGRKDRLGVWG